MKQRIVFATNNAHKLQEVRQILGAEYDVVGLDQIGCNEDIPETSDTISGNALQKARYIRQHYHTDCMADDTGLFVDALDGAPGVYSARYAGEGHDAAANRCKLLRNMAGKTNRSASFRTVIALIQDDREQLFEGRVDGVITSEEHGDHGFGYDSIFQPVGYDKTFAELTAEEKNAISHRGLAVRQLALHLLKNTNGRQ